MKDAEGYHIRPAKFSDVQSVLELSRFWAEEGCTTGYVGCAAEHLQTWLDGGCFFVGEVQNDIIAYAAGVVKLGKGAIFELAGE